MTSSDRRCAILEALCRRRYETVENLAFEFGVSGRSIRNDILILSLRYPIYTVQGYGGGIRIDEKFKLSKEYLKEEQQELLQRLLWELKGRDAEIMRTILDKFGLKGRRNEKGNGNGIYGSD